MRGAVAGCDRHFRVFGRLLRRVGSHDGVAEDLAAALSHSGEKSAGRGEGGRTGRKG